MLSHKQRPVVDFPNQQFSILFHIYKIQKKYSEYTLESKNTAVMVAIV